MNRSRTQFSLLAGCGFAMLLLIAIGFAQPPWRGGGRGGDGRLGQVRGDWNNDPEFEEDVFTFARVQFQSGGGYRGGNGRWLTDYPDSDVNFSFRLWQLTSLKVNPVPVIVQLDSPELFRYPFLYMVEPGDIYLSPDEITGLRRYLQNGGFLMVDDFWGERQWANFSEQITQVFPDRPIVDLPADHEIFRCVYQLEEPPQIPSIHQALGGRNSGRTWETWDSQEVHYRAILDDQQRIMILICHNTDLGDGWEREGVDPWYFREFSEKKAYPLGINIVTYAMTH